MTDARTADLLVGLVGAGGVGARHAATIAGLPGVRLGVVTDPDAERARALASDHGATVCPDLEALLATPRLDAVWLCLPPFAHGATELAVLGAGLPFFVEKPIATDLATAAELAAAVERAGVVTATGYHWRCMPGVEEAAEALAGSTVTLASATWWDKVPPVAWWSSRTGSGGQLVEQATHLVDVLRLLVGEPRAVTAVPAVHAGRDPDLVDPATGAVLRFESGAVATLSATSVLPAKAAAAVTLIAGEVTVEVAEAATTIRTGGGAGASERRIVEDGTAKTRVDAEFLDAVRTGDPARVRVDYAEALRTHRVGCALTESAATGRTVELPLPA